MLGDLIIESRGHRVVRRTLSADPLTVEVTFDDSGKVLGHAYNGFGTYSSHMRPDGVLFGEGQGAYQTADGIAAWRGSGLGTLKAGGAVSYRGILYFQTTSPKLSHLNTVAAVFEYEVAADGATTSKAWEWK